MKNPPIGSPSGERDPNLLRGRFAKSTSDDMQRFSSSLACVQTAAGHEVDFLVELPGGGRELVQVTANLTAARTRQRELRALREAMGELEIDGATVVTLGDAETIEVGGRPVAVVPVCRWLLEPPRS